MVLDQIECSICLKVCEEAVKLKNGCHTFCKQCIDGINPTYNDGEEGIYCPNCKKFTKTKDYQRNFVVHHYARLFRQRPDKSEECGICLVYNTKWKCTVCDISLYEGCKDQLTKGQDIMPSEKKKKRRFLQLMGK